MDYEKEYKEALERAKDVYTYYCDDREQLRKIEHIFPVLKESEDERIKREIIEYIKTGTYRNDWVAWLEKQEQVKDSANFQHENKMCKENGDSLTNEDEKVRKALIEYFNEQCDMSDWNGVYGYQVVAWLEKQGEQKPAWSEDDENHVIGITQIIACAIKRNVVSQKTGEMEISWLKSLRPQNTEKPQGKTTLEAANEPADKIEPRFKVGDWVVANYSGKIGQVVAVSEDGYGYQLNDGLCFGVSWCDIFHLWNIKNDVRDGDILASDSSVFIFQDEYMAGKPRAYCGIVDGGFYQGSDGCWTNEPCYPATKEQRDLLFQKMEEAGYKWDSENKKVQTIMEIRKYE